MNLLSSDDAACCMLCGQEADCGGPQNYHSCFSSEQVWSDDKLLWVLWVYCSKCDCWTEHPERNQEVFAKEKL